MPKLGLSHQEEFGPPPDNARTSQIGEEVLGTIEVLHLDIHGTQFSECVSV
jgi:hypothetical protein